MLVNKTLVPNLAVKHIIEEMQTSASCSSELQRSTKNEKQDDDSIQLELALKQSLLPQYTPVSESQLDYEFEENTRAAKRRSIESFQAHHIKQDALDMLLVMTGMTEGRK